MKNLAKLAAALVAVSLLILMAAPAMALTAGIEVIGEEAGLLLLPEEGTLFDLDNMNPGDTRQATIKLDNRYSTAYHLWIRAEDITADEPSLFEVMELTVSYRGGILYQGPVDGFAGEAIHLGRLQPGDSEEMLLTVHLPGPETGNEYQGKSASAKWIFAAQASEVIEVDPEDPGVTPKEPEEIEITPEKPGVLPQTFGEGVFYFTLLIGILVLIIGLRLAYRRKAGQQGKN